MEKYKNKYRIKSHRKPNWDYSAEGLYFLTIVTQNRECNLGKIVNNEMELSDFGKIVEQEWFKSFEIREELILHEFILMPNHLHAIVEIYHNPCVKTSADDVMVNGISENGIMAIAMDGEMDGEMDDEMVETHGRVSLPSSIPSSSIPSSSIPSSSIPSSSIIKIKRNPPVRLPKSISSFIAGFKSAVNTQIDNYIDVHNLPIPKYNRDNHFFQPNYHDHIIRNHIEYQNISNYIISNPAKWTNDTFHD